MSHSKRNTSRAVFTSYERDLARRAWGSQTTRLARESFLPFASCGLCLSPAADPVACGARGDMFCRECALGNLLAQRQEAKRLERARACGERERDEARARDDDEARRRAVRDFEMTLHGLDAARSEAKTSSTLAAGWNKKGTQQQQQNGAATTKTIDDALPRDDDDEDGKNGDSHNSSSSKRPGKRKLDAFDAEELARAAAEEDRVRARRRLEADKVEAASKTALPSFWTPSMAPPGLTTSTTTDKDASQRDSKNKSKNNSNSALPLCPSSRSDDPHPYSLHTLVTINFTEEEVEEEGGSGKKKQTRRVCPACRKGLTNTSKAVLAKPCGHVLCRSCVDKFVRPGAGADPHAVGSSSQEVLRCYVCEEDLTDRPPSPPKKSKGGEDKKTKKKDRERIRPGLVELRSEGTGFSAGGINEVRKTGIVFQC